jgi:hypothetical protein
MSRDHPRQRAIFKGNFPVYKVLNLESGDSQGEFETLNEARSAVLFDRLTRYEIWQVKVEGNVICGERRVELCDPYADKSKSGRDARGETAGKRPS